MLKRRPPPASPVTAAERRATQDRIEAELAARLPAIQERLSQEAAQSPEQREATLFATLTDMTARGHHIPDQILEDARAKGWTPPDASQTFAALAAGRIGGAGWTPDKQRAFLHHLAEHGCVAHACHHVGLSKQGAHALRARHPTSVFAILWDVAFRMGRRRLWEEGARRALEGREEAVWYRGEQVGTRRVVNDRVLMFMLAHEPPPAHPNLTQRECEELWASLMPSVDADLPPSLSPARIADLAERPRGED